MLRLNAGVLAVALVSVCYAVPLQSQDCDLSGVWTQSWDGNYNGSKSASPSFHKTIVVRNATTPFGTPHAQYVVDYHAALALHPDMQTCLGNGTCSSGQFGKARAVNASAPPCSFIQWPNPKTGEPTDGSWCKSPHCGDVSPPKPMPWPGTYNMSRSTMVFPNGNHSGPDNPTRAAIEARYGMVSFGWEMDVCDTARVSEPSSACKYAGTEAALDAQAARIKAINPLTKVVLYRNTELGLSVYKDQCLKMYDPAYKGFYLQNKSGNTINDPAGNTGGLKELGFCPPVPPVRMDQYFTDFRNASATAWFVDTVVGRVAKSPHADGVWFDDPSGVGAEHPAVVKSFTPAQIQAIRAATAVALNQAVESLIDAGKPLNFNVRMGGIKGIPSVIDATKGRDTARCISALGAAAALGATNAPAVYQIPYFAPPAAGPTLKNDFQQHLAAFLLARGEYSWFGHGWINVSPPVWYPEWDWNVGEPTGPMVQNPGGVFTREWSKGTVVLNCTSWEVKLPFSA